MQDSTQESKQDSTQESVQDSTQESKQAIYNKDERQKKEEKRQPPIFAIEHFSDFWLFLLSLTLYLPNLSYPNLWQPNGYHWYTKCLPYLETIENKGFYAY